MAQYTDITLRFAEPEPNYRGAAGTIDADLERGTLTIHGSDQERQPVNIDGEHFDAFLDCLLEIKAKREDASNGRRAA